MSDDRDPVDIALLSLLHEIENLDVYDGYVNADETAKVISVPLPYVVFYSTPGYDINDRLGGNAGGRAVEFSLTFVGSTREQAKAAGNRARNNLSRRRITVAGRTSGLIVRDEGNLPVRREDDYTAPGGAPLFYGIDSYTVPV